jgi:diguanylate cyclase (GGDEF)-like protein
MLKDDIYHSHLLVHRDGKVTRHPAGRFMVKDGVLHHLEDYHQGLQAITIPAGPVTAATVDRINGPGPHLSVASHHDISNGHRLDFIPEHPLPQMLPDPPQLMQPVEAKEPPKPPSVWHYTRVGHDRPHVLESREGKFMLDGNPLAHDEVATILDNVRTKSGKLRYVKSMGNNALAKAEEMDPQAALAHLGSLGGDDKTNAAVAALRRHVFEDPMNPGIGNKYAYETFRATNPNGVWTSIDVNDLKHLNDTQGHDAGDALIRGFGAAARTAVDPADSKLFRAGGDEYTMWHPTPEAAYSALRNIRHHVDQIPPINGTHRISFSAGLGHTFDHADKALYQAKAQKKLPTGERAFAPGSVPHFAHSMIPGSEGPVPLNESDRTPTPPKLPDAAPAVAPKAA